MDGEVFGVELGVFWEAVVVGEEARPDHSLCCRRHVFSSSMIDSDDIFVHDDNIMIPK